MLSIMRWLLIAALLCVSFSATAKPMYGGSGLINVCPTGSPSPDGATITPNNLTCMLIDSVAAGSNVWKFSSNGQPNNSALNLNGTPTFSALSAHYCGSIGAVFFNVDYSTLIGVSLGTYIIWDAGTSGAQQNGLCNLATANARNVTTSTNYGMPKAALAAAAAGQTITTTALPAGVPFFVSAGGIVVNNVTFSPAAGAKFATSSGVSPSGILTITGAGATVNGGEYEFQDNAIRIASAASGATLDGSVVPLILHDCNASCLLTGSQEGTLTIKDLIVYNGGDLVSGGQDHNVYISTNGTGTDNTAPTITGIRSYDVIGGGWTLKFRPGTGNITGTATNYFIGCQHSSSAACEQNGVVDFPCFGNHTISNMVLERGPGADNWYNVRAGEEIGLPGNCPNTGYATNSITISNSILIDDSPSTGAPGFGSTALCLGGSSCTSNASSPSGAINNSILILNPSGTVMGLGPAVTGSGNTTYASRQAYCTANPSVQNTADIFGNNSGTTCAFPWVPPRPGVTGLETALTAMAADSFKLISAGTQGNYSSAGTPNDCAHFDGGGTVGGTPCSTGGTWTSLAALQAQIASPDFSQSWPFSGAGIRTTDHKIGHHGGGHAVLQHDSGFYTFDVDAASIALCTPSCFTGSRTGAWTRVVDSARLLDSFTRSRPAYSPQQSEGTPSGANQFYWATTNQSGQQMWDACHSYFSVKPIPTTNYFDVSCGVIYGSAANTGAHWMVDTSTPHGSDSATVIGPYVLATPVGNITGATGLAGSPQGTACFDTDGTAYTFGFGGASYDFFKWNNPTANNYSLTKLATGGAHDPLTNDGNGGENCVLIPDPTNSSFRAVFIYNNLVPGTFEWWMVTGLAGGTPTINAGTFNGGIPANCASTGLSPTLNTVNGTILTWLGNGHVCKITPSATLANITISEITVSPTGDVPVTAGAGLNVPANQFFHFPSADGLVLQNASQVWLYRCKNAGCT